MSLNDVRTGMARVEGKMDVMRAVAELERALVYLPREDRDALAIVRASAAAIERVIADSSQSLRDRLNAAKQKLEEIERKR